MTDQSADTHKCRYLDRQIYFSFYVTDVNVQRVRRVMALKSLSVGLIYAKNEPLIGVK